MDVVWAKPCSITFKLQTSNNNNNNNMACISMSSSLTTATPITRNPPTSYHFRKISLRSTAPGTLVADQVLNKEDDNLMKVYKKEDEVDEVIARLKMAAERLRETEIEKFMSKVKGGKEVSSSRIAADAEEMSREIFSKFLEKPIEYLTSDDAAGCFQQKLKDVRVLLGILENSCPYQKDKPSF